MPAARRAAAFRRMLTALLFCATTAPALAKRTPNPNDRLKSVEVTEDGRVTFRIYAPKATEVSVSGDFGPGLKLTKDEAGVWSATTEEPLAPEFSAYNFNVDDVRTVDPKNVSIKPGISSLENMFEVPGDVNAFQALLEVPHGEVRTVWYRSKAHGGQRRMHVYTPPGYEKGDERFPVFYLLHGGGDDDAGWTTIGRANFILDNLIADGRAMPMIVVMPDGSMTIPPEIPRPARGELPSPEYRAAAEAVQARFVDDLTGDILPYIEQTYRAKTGRENRALAGLSMGGGQTLSTLVAHPNQFAYVGIWSAGLFRDKPEDWATANSEFLKRADQLNTDLRLLTITIGDKDFLLQRSQALESVLREHGVKFDSQLTAGGHTWQNWRHYLSEFAPKLFR